MLQESRQKLMLVANNEAELESMLRRINTSVPRRSEGRTTEQVERYAVAHMLSALLGKGQLSYPLELIQRERPDFLLKANGLEIGIEHTEAVSQNEAQQSFLRDKIGSPRAYPISRHQPGERIKTRKELIKEIKTNHFRTGWAGDSVERGWSDAMPHFVERKIKSFTNEYFEKFAQNWLLIYDNWSLPALDIEGAEKFLLQKLSQSNCFDSFGSVYIITLHFVCEFSSPGATRYEINDLWK